MTDAQLYREAVRLSGLSARQFTTRIAWHDERTGRRWSDGGPMADRVRENLQWFVALSPRDRQRVVSILTQR